MDRSTIRWGQVGSGPLGPLLVGREMSGQAAKVGQESLSC